MVELAKGIVESGAIELHAVVPSEGPLLSRLTSFGVTTSVIPHLTWTDFTSLRQHSPSLNTLLRYGAQRARSVGRLLRLLRRHRYDVVISNTNTIVTPALAAKLTRTPHVWYVQEFGEMDHGLHYDIGFERSMALIGKLSCRVLVPSEAVRSMLQQWIDPNQLRIVLYAVYGPEPLPDPRDDGTWRLALVGRKAPGKGQREALDAVAELRRMGHPARLRLVGGGDPSYVNTLRDHARMIDIEASVDFVGATAHVAEHYEWAQVVLMCSRAEAFGRVTVEAMKYGRPVVGARAAGTAALIRHGENGLLYDSGNAVDLASKVAQLMSDPERTATLTRRAQQWAQETFSLERYVDGFTTELREAVRASQGAGRAGKLANRGEVVDQLFRMARRMCERAPLLSRLLRRTPAVTLAERTRNRLSGGRVPVGNGSILAPGRFKEWYRSFEPLTLRWIEHHLRPGMTAVDVGAHIGFVAVRMAQLVGPEGRVIAVEPAPDNLRYLRRNLRPYAKWCDVVDAAVGARSGSAVLRLTSSSDSHGLYDHPLTDTSDQILVDLIALDDLVLTPDFVMIDVEGAELDVLEGMERILHATPTLLVEWMPACQIAAGRGSSELPDLLKARGYQLTVLDDIYGVERSPDEVIALLAEAVLAPNWYANIACTRG